MPKARPYEKAPAWAEDLVKEVRGLSERMDKIEQRPLAEQAPQDPREALQKLVDAGIDPKDWGKVLQKTDPKKPVVMRCELCNEPYSGVQPAFGTPRICKKCAKPGVRIGKCACGKPVRTDQKGDVICDVCRKCIVCGDKSSPFVCARCISSGAVRVCDGCTRLAKRGSAFCELCDRAYRQKNAAAFTDTQIPGADPRAIDDVQQAIQTATVSGDIETASRLAELPDLQPALPG